MNAAKTRLLFVVENERYGGGERAFAQLINGLDKGRFDIYVACLTGTPGAAVFIREISRSAMVISLDLRRLVNFRAVPALRALIREYAIELVHSQGPRADFYCRLALDGSGVKHVCTVASPVEEYDVGPLKKVAYIVADRFLAPEVNSYVAVAGHIKIKLMDKGLPESKVSVIYNGVDAAHYAQQPEPPLKVREKMGLSPDNFLVAAFCRLSAEKGLFTLLDAADLSCGGPIKYVISGDGPLEGKLRARIDELGLQKEVILSGFAEDVRPLLHAADVVVLPSLREGFPMSVLEAMAAGKPVVASRIAGVDESVEDGLTGLLVPPEDFEALSAAIKSLAADRRKAAEMGARGRASAQERFGLSKMIIAHEELYSGLVSA